MASVVLLAESGACWGRSCRGGCSRARRRSWSWRTPAGVMASPRQPRDARSSTAQAMLTQLVSPGKRPITLVRRRVSPKVRSMIIWSAGHNRCGELRFCVVEGVYDAAGSRCRSLVSAARLLPNCEASAARLARFGRCRGSGRGHMRAGGVAAGSRLSTATEN